MAELSLRSTKTGGLLIARRNSRLIEQGSQIRMQQCTLLRADLKYPNLSANQRLRLRLKPWDSIRKSYSIIIKTTSFRLEFLYFHLRRPRLKWGINPNLFGVILNNPWDRTGVLIAFWISCANKLSRGCSLVLIMSIAGKLTKGRRYVSGITGLSYSNNKH